MRRNNFLISVVTSILLLMMVGGVSLAALAVVDHQTGIITQARDAWKKLENLPL